MSKIAELDSIKIESTEINADEATITEKETWFIQEKDGDGAEISYIRFLIEAAYPRRGQRHRDHFWFRVEGTSMSGILRDAENRLKVEITVRYKGLPPPKPNDNDAERLRGPVFPWNMPLANYKLGGASVEEAAKELYARNGKSVPFKTSAGTAIMASKQRNLETISFSYALPEPAFREEFLTTYREAINLMPQTIAGRRYKSGMVKITNIDAERLQEELGPNGKGGDLHYWNVALTCTIDPKTWWRDIANVSTFFRPTPGSPFTQIWTTETVYKDKKAPGMKPLFDYYGVNLLNYEAENTEGEVTRSARHYGSRELMARFNSSRMEAVTEPLYLFPDGLEFWDATTKEMRPFQQLDPYDNLLGASGAILPFDRTTGRQFLGSIIPSKYPADNLDRWGYWRPVMLAYDTERKENRYTIIRNPDSEPNLDEKLIHEVNIAGYQTKPIRFNDLRIPKHTGMRWDDFSQPEPDES